MKSKPWAMLIVSVAIAFFLPGSGRAGARAANIAAQSPVSSAASSKVPNKLALLVAINNYRNADLISPLSGSINDIEDMRQVLIGKFDFPPENIVVLKDAQATHAGIMQAIQTHLIAKARPGDIVVFEFSGHGSQMRDVTGKKSSGLDETIVPYDSRDLQGKVFDISGTELHASLVQLASKTSNLTFILDSCHSGTLVRGARVRFIPPDTRPVPSEIASITRGLGPSREDEATPKFVSISAATSRENAFEHFAEGEDHGALTYFLTRQLRNARANATYRDVMDSVSGNVTGNYPSQHPSLEGAGADQRLFGDATVLAANYVIASPSLRDVKRVTLNVGQVQGATVGSTYDVYAPGTKKFAPPEKPIARVQIVTVTAFTSEATALTGSKITAVSRAVEREHRYANARVRLYFDGLEQSPVLQQVQQAMNGIKWISVVDRPGRCNIQLRPVGQNIQILSADSTTLSAPVRSSDPAAAAARLISQLQQWARFYNVLAINNAPEELNVSLTLKAAPSAETPSRQSLTVHAGQEVTASLVNNSERDLYVVMLDLASDGSISVVYPEQRGVAEVLRPHLTLTRSFNTTVPTGRALATDVLKAFVSYKPFDPTSLTQAAVREVTAAGELDPLEELLMDSAGVSRGLTPLLNKPIDLGGWATAQRVLVVRRKS